MGPRIDRRWAKLRPSGDVRLTVVCPSCGAETVTDLPGAKFDVWKDLPPYDRPHVQDFWPELTPSQRETCFMSGICDRCWNAMFKEDDDD